MGTRYDLMQKLSSGAKHGLIGSIGGRFLSVLGSVVVARILGPTVFGLYAIGWNLLRFVSLIMPLGMDRGFLRFAPKYWGRDNSGFKGLLIQTILIALGSGLIFGITLFVSARWLAIVIYEKPELKEIFRLYALVLPLLSLLLTFSAITRVTQKIKYSVITKDLGQPILWFILLGIFFIFGLDLKGVVFADVLSISLSCLGAIWIIIKLFPETIKSKTIFQLPVKQLFSYSIPAVCGGAFSVYIFWIDRILVGYFCTAYENGVYLAISQISTLFLVITAGINGIVVPLFSDLYTKNEDKKINEVYKISAKWAIYISAPFLTIILISPGEILSVIYGEPFRDGSNILLILIIGQVINLITGSVNPLLGMTGNHKFLFKLSATIFLFNIIFNIALIPHFGLIGAAISTSLSLSTLYIFEIIWVKKNLNLWPYDRRFIKGIVAFLAAFASSFGIKLIVHLPPFFFLLLQTFCAIIVFAITLFIQKIDDEDKYFLSSFFHRYVN